MPGSAKGRFLSERHRVFQWGGAASAWVGMVLKSVLLLSRNVQERERESNLSYRLAGLIVQLSLCPSTAQAELEKLVLRVPSQPFTFLVRDFSHLSGKR